MTQLGNRPSPQQHALGSHSRIAKSYGHDGIIVKRTYDPATDVARIVGNSQTDVYIVFDADRIFPA